MTTWAELIAPQAPGRQIKPIDNSVGFLPAFETLEAFRAAYPGETPLMLKRKDRANGTD